MKTTINALDPSQKFILEKLSKGNADDLSLVYGPPGTGKSHLIVSLLFELACSGKKVLFVSQNREALEVVIRKYRDLDKEMNLGDTDLTFLDFCLHLSDRSQRTLKHIMSLRSRIWTKTTRRITDVSSFDEEIPYALFYRSLDKERNYSDGDFDKKDEIGLDMLLANQLEFVKDEKIIKKSLHFVENINASRVFSLLKEYKDKSSNFRHFNNPSNELRLFSRIDNAAITLNKIHDSIYEITDAYAKIPKLSEVSHSKDNDIRTILRFLAVLKNISMQYEIDAIKNDSVKLDYIFGVLNTIQNNTKKIKENGFNFEGITLPSKPVMDTSACDMFKLCGSVAELEEYKKELELLAQCIKDSDCKDSAMSVNEMLHCVIKGLRLDFYAIDSMINIRKSDAKTIDSFTDDVLEWAGQTGLSRLFAIKPQTLDGFSNEEVEKIAREADSLKTIVSILNGTDFLFGDLEKAIKGTVSNKKIQSNKTTLVRIARDILQCINGRYYSWIKKYSCGELYTICKGANDELKQVISILKQSKKLSDSDVRKSVSAINDEILNRKIIEENIKLYDSIKKYIKDSSRNWRSLPATNDKSKLIDSILDEIDYGDSIEVFDIEKIESLRKAIDNVEDAKIFNKEFFRVTAREKVHTWKDRIESLLAFEDREELGDYILHNDFIMKLGKVLGDANKDYLEAYLKMDMDFEDFAQHIAYDLIRALFGNIPASKCRSVNSDRYFNSFSKGLDKARKKYYEDMMESMAIRFEDPAKHLAIRSEWRSTGTGSVMELIRNNTQKIIDAYPVIMATPAEVAKYLAPNKEMFDYVIFDEASQLLPGQALPSLYRAKKAVIVGDPHQMPPTSSVLIGASNKTADYNDEFDELGDSSESILDKVKSMQIDSAYHLKVHYRSKYNILFEPSREAIYSQDDIRPIFEAKSVKMPLYIRDSLGEDQNTGFEAIIERVNNYIEENNKATFCVLFTKKTGVGGESEFKKFLEEKGEAANAILQKYSNEELLISTVTNCQGISGDHTILYIPAYRSPRAMWFFRANAGAYKRLNVAITRQIESLDIIMGDDKEKWISVCQEMISNPSTAPDILISAQLMEGLLINAGRQINEQYLDRLLGPNADEIDSPLTEELYEKLNDYFAVKYPNEVRIWCEVGYKIRIPDGKALNQNSYNVGYRIDIGIYSCRHKKFILGIEMDGATYHSGFIKEFSDAQRQEILENKGWKIYRIWSTNWLNNPEGEFNSLIEAIEEELEKEPEPEPIVTEFRIDPSIREDKLDDEDSGEGLEAVLEQERQEASYENDSKDLIEETLPSSADAMVDYWDRLRKYLENCFKLGKVINIKYVPKIDDGDVLNRVLGLPYQKMIIRRIFEESIEASFEDIPSPYKIYLKNIVAYKNEE